MRQRRTRQEWQALLDEQPRSELSIQRFCQSEGITPSSFYSWRTKLRRGESSAPDPLGAVRDLWADSAYRSQANEEKLAARGLRSHIHKKGQRNKPLSKAQQRANTRKSKVRVRVEHVFGSMTNEQGGLYFRVIGLARTATRIGLMNLVYNMRRLAQIDKLRASGV